MLEKIVQFKSFKQYYLKELNGSKANTVRLFKMYESKFKLLAEMALKKDFGTIEIIEIDNTHKPTGNSFFRPITDVTFWDRYVIISWSAVNE